MPRIASATAYSVQVITPRQIRAARALLGLKQVELAAAAGISVQAVKLLETGKTDPRVSTLSAIETALSNAGVTFIDASEDGGVGVRLNEIERKEPREI
jgi:predicted transcriptional regulator